VIIRFRHKGLQRFFATGDHRGIDAKQAARIRRLLDRLDASTRPEDLNLPGLGFHPLKGDRKGTYAVWVSGNWRITFRYGPDGAHDVNLEDYH
jgi:proteic killer suppression protein